MADTSGPVPEPVPRLCRVCGSTTFEQVDESHVRCVECGHGAAFTRLVAVANPNPSSTDLARAEERFHDARDGNRSGDPTAEWDRVSLPVDDELVEFAALTEGVHWAAQAILGEQVVGVQARHWKLDVTGLVTEIDFAPYSEGAKEIRRRMMP